MLHALNAPRHLRAARPTLRRFVDAAAPAPVTIDFNPAQYEFVTSDHVPNMAFVGGLGSGKTFGLNWWLVFEQYFERGSGTVGGLFANTYQQLEQATLPGLWDAYEKLGFRYGDHYVYGERPPLFWEGYESKFKRHNGVISHRFLGQLITRSLDNPHSIRGIEIGFAGHDEMRDSPRSAFNVLMGRIRCPLARRHRYRGSTTPDGFNWIYEVFLEKRKPRFGLVRGRSYDNFALPPEYLENLTTTYDPKTLRQEVEGEFLNTTSGAVYHQFDRRVHVRPDIAPNPKLEWQVCFDFNRSPMTCVLCQTVRINGVQIVFCLDEVRLLDSGSVQAAKEVLDRLFKHCNGQPPTHVDIFGDAAGNNINSTASLVTDYDNITNEFSARIKNRFSRRWKFSNPGVHDRINAVNGLLRNGKGQVRCYVHPRCEHLIKDFERVTYTVGSSSINKTGEENKMLTHLSDGFGYMVESVFPVRPDEIAGRISL